MAISDSGDICIAWLDRTWEGANGGSYVVVGLSSNGGSSWTVHTPYAGIHTEFGESRWVLDVVFDHDMNIWLLWSYSPSKFVPFELRLSKSTDDGQTFQVVFTAQEHSEAFRSQLAVDDANGIYMLWDDAEVKLTRFRNGYIAQRIDAELPNDTLGVGFFPSIVVTPDYKVYCFWQGSYNQSAYHDFAFCSTSLDTGLTFARTVRVDTADIFLPSPGGRHQSDPVGAVDNSGVVFALYSKAINFSSNQLLLANSRNEGESFLLPVPVESPTTVFYKSLCVDAGQGLNLLWRIELSETKHTRSTDQGITFSDPVFVGYGGREIASGPYGEVYATLELDRLYFTSTNVLVDVAGTPSSMYGIALQNNYPNPFNPETRIEFRVSGSVWVSLKIFDVLGREVLTLVDELVHAGSHQATLDASNLASGMYFYRMNAGTYTSTKKLVILK